MSAQDVLVSTDWVAQHGNDAGIKLVEVDVDTNAYDEGHVAGAVGLNWTSQLQDQVRRDIITQRRAREAAQRQPASATTTPSSSTATTTTGSPPTPSGCWRCTATRTSSSWTAAARSGWTRTARPRRTPPKHHASRLQGRASPTQACAPSATRCCRAWASADKAPGRRALARRVHRRDPRAARAHGDGAARRPHPRRRQRPLGARPSRKTAPSSPPTSSRRSTAARASPPTRTSSPTAASASAPRTPGSSSSTCSASRTSELRRLLDRVGQHGRRAGREALGVT